MLWKNPEKKDKPIFKYNIYPGSPLHIPVHITAWPTHFEEKVRTYLEKEVEDHELLIALTQIYREHKQASVEVVSSLSKSLASRHEKIVIEMVKANITHIETLLSYVSR